MEGSTAPKRPRPLSPLESLVIAHVGIFIVGATWAFGGGAGYVRPPLALWGSLGALITLAAVSGDQIRTQVILTPLKWLWPFVLFNALVIASSFTPLLKTVTTTAGSFVTPVTVSGWRPASAEPDAVLRTLWLFDASYIACFNIALVVRHRRAIRILLLIAGANALALSVFGTVQRLGHSTGLFFGAVPSPQPFFFASFIYHNHWGALIILMSAISIGLARYYARSRDGRDVFHTPAFLIVVAVLFFAITVPLSGSRSCSVLLALLLSGAFLGWTRRLIRTRRGYGESVAPPLVGAVVAIALALFSIWYLAGDVITSRIAKTGEQLVDMRERGDIGGRNILYGDTIRMARDRPLLGWGMASYPHVFWMYNTQEPNPIDHIPVYYHDAHSDWLQAFAEHGVIGAALLALCALVPLWGLRRADLKGPLIRYPLVGCALLLLYAWIEFPFGNVAVVLAWWYCYFCGVSYAILSKAIKEARDKPEEAAPTGA